MGWQSCPKAETPGNLTRAHYGFPFRESSDCSVRISILGLVWLSSIREAA
jgi:hypothetical protein